MQIVVYVVKILLSNTNLIEKTYFSHNPSVFFTGVSIYID